MDHDFAPQHGGIGGKCDNKGIMSYNDPPPEWSTCSKSDWEKAYFQENWGNGCLEDISGAVSLNQ